MDDFVNVNLHEGTRNVTCHHLPVFLCIDDIRVIVIVQVIAVFGMLIVRVIIVISWIVKINDRCAIAPCKSEIGSGMAAPTQSVDPINVSFGAWEVWSSGST